MEKLHAVRQDERWDLIVLDTPPTSNALDFLDAPERLVGAIDSQAMRWFIQTFQGAGKMSFGMVGRGAAFMMRGLSKFTGMGFLEQVAEFVTSLNDLFGGFRDRANEVAEALRSPDVAFVLVTSPRPMAVREAIFFADRLGEAGMRRDAFVVNGLHPLLREPQGTSAELAEAAREVLPEGADPRRAVARMQQALDDERVLALGDRHEANKLKEAAGDETSYIEVPAFERDVHDLEALARVAEYLTGKVRLKEERAA